MKKIIGFTGTRDAREKARDVAIAENIKCVSMKEHVMRIACSNYDKIEDPDDDGAFIRRKGMRINPHYWINLLLPIFVQDANLVIIWDLFEEEFIEDVIQNVYVAVEGDEVDAEDVIFVDEPKIMQHFLHQVKQSV